jgi:hypothetical protein
VEGSNDGAAWQVPQNCDYIAGSEHVATWKPKSLRHVRITITGLVGGLSASIREVRVFEHASYHHRND